MLSIWHYFFMIHSSCLLFGFHRTRLLSNGRRTFYSIKQCGIYLSLEVLDLLIFCSIIQVTPIVLLIKCIVLENMYHNVSSYSEFNA